MPFPMPGAGADAVEPAMLDEDLDLSLDAPVDIVPWYPDVALMTRPWNDVSQSTSAISTGLLTKG